VLGRISVEESIARSRYDGMNFSYRQRMTKHFSLNANYTLSRAVGWAIDASGFRNYPHDPRNLWDPRDFGNTPNDERHHITLSGVVSLPWGIQVAPILQFGTARPFDLTLPARPLAGGLAVHALVVAQGFGELEFDREAGEPLPGRKRPRLPMAK
jgi:hypothetical protein